MSKEQRALMKLHLAYSRESKDIEIWFFDGEEGILVALAPDQVKALIKQAEQAIVDSANDSKLSTFN